MSDAPRGPLGGVRVLDLGRYVAAPYCGMVLADMGAEVIRVERPGGEEDRRLGLRAANGETFTFAGLARGKRGITLDPRPGGAGAGVLRDLVARSDVLLHNFAAPAARALGLGYADVRAMRPAIVYAAISFAACDGPHAGRTGFDMMAQVASGAAALTGREGDAPLRSGVPWVDYATGLGAALGILLALRHRDATGEGQAVDCALLRTALSFTAPAVAEAVVTGRERPREGNQAPYVAPANLYRCLDGHVYAAAVTPATWRALAALVGRPDLAGDPALATPEDRYRERARLDALIEAWTERRPARDVLAALERARVPGSAYRSTAEVAGDPVVREQALLGRVDLGLPGLERVPVGPTPVRLSAVPAVRPRRPPGIGEHNDEVYGGVLGYGRARIARLREDGVI